MKTKMPKKEKEILESFEKGEWVPVKNLSERKRALAEYARSTLKKDRRLNVRSLEKERLK